MARYLVGEGSNAWPFYDAYEAAQNGDILEFEKNYSLDFLPTVNFRFEKSLTLCGHAEVDEEGGNVIYSQFNGHIRVAADVELTIEDICVYSNGDNNAIYVEKGGNLNIFNAIIGNTNENNNRAIIVTNDANIVKITNLTLYNVEGKEYKISLLGGADIEITKSHLGNLYIENIKDLRVSDCSSSYFQGNAFNIKKSKVSVENCYIEGGDSKKNFPAFIATNNSELIIKNCTIKQEKYRAACYIESSKATIDSLTATSIRFHDTRARIQNSTVSEQISLYSLSLVLLKEETKFLCEGTESIPLVLHTNSVALADKLIFNEAKGVDIKIMEESHLRVKTIVNLNGSSKDVDIVTDESGGSVENLNKEENKETQENEENQTQASAKDKLDNLIGLRKVKNAVNEMLNIVVWNKQRLEQGLPPEEHNLHAAFVGSPGTGKTTVARLMSEILFEKGLIRENKLIEVSRTDLVGQYKGHTGPQTRKVLEKARGGILFIDEAYTLMTGEGDNFGQEAIDEIMKYMEDNADDIMIILAGYTKEINELIKANPGFKSRVTNTFDFEDYTPEEIAKMGEANITSRGNVLEDKDYYEKYVKRAYSASLDKSNGRWIRNMNDKISKALAKRVVGTSEQINLIRNVDIDAVMNSGKYQNDGRKADAYEQLNKLIGIKKVKEQVEQFVANAQAKKIRQQQGRNTDDTSLHSMFLGNPGTGKTTVARILGELLYQKDVIAQNKFVEVSRTDLIAPHVGQTAQKTRRVLESALGGILFIDEAYALAAGGPNDFGKEAVDEILKFMEDYRDNIVIIFAGYTKEMEDFINMNSGLRSRVPHVFDFEDYSPDEIVEIGLLGLSRSEYNVDKELYEKTIKDLYKESTDNSNGRWIRNINEKLIMHMSTRVSRSGSDNFDEITKEDLKMLLGGELGETTDAYEQLNNLIGIKKVKEQVEEFIALAEINKRREEEGYKNDSFSLHSQFLGNPGTGKTTVARIVGKILYQKNIIKKDIFVEVTRADLIAGYVGQTAQKTRDVLEKARGGVLFVDEAYTLVGNGSNDFGQEAVDELMKFMEDNRDEIVVIFAGYEKEMADFIKMNSGLASRVANTFDFEDYSPDEIAQIGLLRLNKFDYKVNEEHYTNIVKELYAKTNDHSNGRWVRNINEKIIVNMSMRVSKNGGDINTITNEDIDKIKDR